MRTDATTDRYLAELAAHDSLMKNVEASAELYLSDVELSDDIEPTELAIQVFEHCDGEFTFEDDREADCARDVIRAIVRRELYVREESHAQ